MSWRERKASLTAVLRDFLANPALTARDLLERCSGLGASSSATCEVLRELVPEPSPRFLEAARWLVANGTDRGAVLLGLGLLAGRAGQPPARDDQHGKLPLRDHPVRAGPGCLRPVGLGRGRPATLERAALLAMVRQDLATGPAAVAVRDHARLADKIQDVLLSRRWREMLERGAACGDPVQARRAAWVIREAAAREEPGADFSVRVVVPDPKPGVSGGPEARIMTGGVPVIAAAFDKGPANPPEYLLHSGRLRAGEAPHEVMLAEAYCTEGYCGALYVTIVRDGPEVVWKDWRSSMKGDPPPEARFNAAAYDREVARAERDYSWEWPARTAARLLNARLRADPDILGRWGCKPGWCTAWLKDFTTARLTFTYPANATFGQEPWTQFGLVIDIQDQDPETVAEQLTESLRDTDPKTSAEMIGGSRDSAEKLGLTYKQPTRW